MSPRSSALLRGFCCVLIFLAALGAVGWTIHEALPFPDIPIVRAKVERFAEAHDQYNTLFIGSSRIHYQIIPSIFDQMAAEAGVQTTSYNAGVAGMRPPETDYFFDYLMRTPPKNLRWVFIELSSLRASVDAREKGTIREVYWHDWPRLWVLFQRSLVSKLDGKPRKFRKRVSDVSKQLVEFVGHVDIFMRNVTNIGRGSTLTSRLLNGPQPRRRAVSPGALGPALDGWIRTGRPEEITGKQLQDYDEDLSARRKHPAQKEWGDVVSQRALAAMVEQIEKLGAKAVLLVPPVTSKRNFHPLPELADRVMVLDFSDLQQFPELFEHRYRLDTDHVNTAGAEAFTRALAQTWAARVKSGQ